MTIKNLGAILIAFALLGTGCDEATWWDIAAANKMLHDRIDACVEECVDYCHREDLVCVHVCEAECQEMILNEGAP